MIKHLLFLTFFICPGNPVVAAESPELNRTIVTGGKSQTSLPFIIDQIVQHKISRFGLHIPGEQSGNRRFAGCAAVIYNVPPGDAHHIFDTEPDSVKVPGDDSLNSLSPFIVVGLCNSDFAQMNGQLGLG